jgi:hydrogenase 3 maturation protease
MSEFLPALRSALAGVKCLAVLAAGSHLRGDDAAGMLVAEELEKRRNEWPGEPAVHVFLGETAPENFTGAIRAVAPSHLLLIDAADMGLAVGQYQLIQMRASPGAAGSTHKMPMHVLVNYVRKTIGCAVITIGIQPGHCRFGAPVSPEVSSASARLAAEMIELLKRINSSK